MSFFEFYAFILNPLLLVAVGLGGAWLHGWDLKRRERRTLRKPAE